MSLLAGTSRAVITPPLTLPHAGWGAQTHVLPRGVEEDLWTTVLVLTQRGTTAVIVDLDLCSLTPEQAGDMRRLIARALDIAPACVRVSVTHTHAGPYLWTDYYEEKKQSRLAYLEQVMEQTVGCALQAVRSSVPVTVGAGSAASAAAVSRRQTLDDGRVVCGTQRDGYADPTLGVVRFDGPDGEPVACIVHYSMHPTILGHPNQLVSPDYPGALKRTVEANLGGRCLFLQGATGDIGPGEVGYTADIAAMRRIGRTLGCTASAALLGLSTRPTEFRWEGVIESGCSLGVWSEVKLEAEEPRLIVATERIRFSVKPSPPPDEARAAAGRLREALQRLQAQGGTEEEIREVTFRLKRQTMAADHSDLYYGVEHKDVEVQYICVGDIALVGLPLEPFARIGADIRELSPFAHTLFSGYTNGWEGYLPTTDAYPHGGYEVDTTPFAPGSDRVLTEGVAAMLDRIKQENR